jgi:hypothetical protein
MLHGPRQYRTATRAEKATGVYLNDHLAGATLGADLARRLRDWTVDSVHAATMRELAAEIEEDKETLVAIMGRLDVAPNPVKQATTWLGEKLSRVKLSGLGSGDEPTGLFLALETLGLGIEGKACLWRILRALSEHHPGLDPQQLDGLIARAESQRRRLEEERRAAGAQALLEDSPAR